jgi:hypothetical protein
MDFIKKAAGQFSNKDKKEGDNKGSEQKDDYVDKGE